MPKGRPRVQFVSKPIVPPFHDGTKCLVRDIATHLSQVSPIVMGLDEPPPRETSGGDEMPTWEVAPVYGGRGSFSPGLRDNLRAARYLLTESRADLWHFVFAANPRSSAVGRALRAARRKPVLQTVASPPRDMSRPDRLLFGDVVVTQSAWTAARLREGYSTQASGGWGAKVRALGSRSPRIEVIPPPVDALERRSERAMREAWSRIDLPWGAPVFVYPGDLEMSQGAPTVARLVAGITERVPGAIVVFAFRDKTSGAQIVADQLAQQLAPERVRFTKNVPDVLALCQEAQAILFPVDDLYGKVDLPIVLLEAMSLGVPVLALAEGPLTELEGSVQVPAVDAAWLDAAERVVTDPVHRRQVIDEQRGAIERRHAAGIVSRAYEELYLELLAPRSRRPEVRG